MDNNPKPTEQKLNPYLILGVSLATNLTVIALVLIVTGLMYLFKNFIPDGSGAAIAISTAIAIIAISVGIPILIASRKGWRNAVATVIATLVMQLFIFLFITVILSAISGNSPSDKYRYYSDEVSPKIGVGAKD